MSTPRDRDPLRCRTCGQGSCPGATAPRDHDGACAQDQADDQQAKDIEEATAEAERHKQGTRTEE